MTAEFEALSCCELRLLLAEVECTRAKSLAGIWRKQNRLNEITAELARRGSF